MALADYPQELGNPREWIALDAVDRIGRFGDLVEAAETGNVFDGLPTDSRTTREESYTLRGQVIAERLWLLGYLDAESKQAARETFARARKTRFIPAVKAFQSDMGLRVDEWPGPITWETLAQLVSFENDNLDATWLKNPGTYPALLRAAQCRLAVLGLARRMPKREFKTVSAAAVVRFHHLVFALNALGDRDAERKLLNSGKLTEQSLALLLDQDRLIQALSRAWEWRKPPAASRREKYFRYFFTQEMSNLSRDQLKTMVNGFIYRITLVEFWLLGYDIDLGQQPDRHFPVKGWGMSGSPGQVDKTLRGCLEDFARRIGRSVHLWRQAITPELFIALASPPDADSTGIDEVLLDRFNSAAEIETALDTARKSGPLRLWDGVRRVARWLVSIFRKAVENVKNWTANLARFFYSKALEAYDAVKYAISLVVESLKNLDGYQFSTEEFAFVVNPDGDHGVFVDVRANLEHAHKLVQRLRLESKRFVLAAHLLGFLLEAMTQSLLSRWAALARTLFVHARRCREIIQEIYAIERNFPVVN